MGNEILIEEEKFAVELINKIKIDNLNQLEIEFQKNNLPLKDKYVFYYISLMHQQNPEDKNSWGTESCKYRFYSLKSSWWKKYLEYERPIKQKLRLENNPELSSLDFLELYQILDDKLLHSQFIKLGWNYKNQMDLYFEKTKDFDLEDENANWNIKNAKSMLEVYSELSDIRAKYDPKPKISYIKRRSYKNSEYCPACQQIPCMCSDPY